MFLNPFFQVEGFILAMKPPCKFCHGTGQISFFNGVSRFFLTEEECPECAGLGFELADNALAEKKSGNTPKKIANKKKISPLLRNDFHGSCSLRPAKTYVITFSSVPLKQQGCDDVP